MFDHSALRDLPAKLRELHTPVLQTLNAPTSYNGTLQLPKLKWGGEEIGGALLHRDAWGSTVRHHIARTHGDYYPQQE